MAVLGRDVVGGSRTVVVVGVGGSMRRGMEEKRNSF